MLTDTTGVSQATFAHSDATLLFAEQRRITNPTMMLQVKWVRTARRLNGARGTGMKNVRSH